MVHVRVKTLRGIALELAEPLLAARELVPLSRRGATLLVARLLNTLGQNFEYFRGLTPNLRLAETFLRSIEALRDTRVRSLEHGVFSDPRKGRDLGHLFRAFEAELARRRLADPALLTQLALERLGETREDLPADLKVLLASGLELTNLERALVESLGAGGVEALPPAEEPAPENCETDLELLRHLGEPHAAPRARGDGTVTLFRALGETNEAREVLRQVAAEGIPLDQVEVLHTSAAVYPPLLREAALLLAALPEDGEVSLPMTFAEGLPTSLSRPGRALQAWVAWIREGFPQMRLVSLIREGLARPSSGGEDPPSQSRMAEVLASLPIGLGRARTLACIESGLRSIDALRTKQEPDEDPEEPERETEETLGTRREALTDAQGLVTSLLATAAEPGTPSRVLRGAAQFLEELAGTAGELDEYSRRKLVDEIADMADWIEREGEGVELDPWTWLEALPRSTAVMGSGPRPGCLHVASLASGGHTGRRRTFIVGLNEGKLGRGGQEDPILLDDERRSIDPELGTSADLIARRSLELRNAIARLKGRVTLSYSSTDLADDSELFPDPAVLAVHRLVSNDRGADLSALERALARSTVSFAPSSPSTALSSAEVWLAHLCSAPPTTTAEALVDAAFPWVASGRTALRSRLLEASVTPHDGLVPGAGSAFDPTGLEARPVSATGLEAAGQCLLKYFFRHVLGLKAPEDLEVDVDRWLEPRTFGNLLHEVFEELLRELAPLDWTENPERQVGRARQILAKHAARYRELYPPPGASAHERQMGDLRHAVQVFLFEEAAYARENRARPRHFEVSLGLPPGSHSSELDSPGAVPVALGSEGRVLVRGRIDRVDQLGAEGDSRYAIWDYKTGSASRHFKEKNRPSGAILQPALYLPMVERRLRDLGKSTAVVEHFGFFFPARAGQGQRVEWTRDECRKLLDTVGLVCSAIREGVFLPSPVKETCRYCDYASICPDREALEAGAALKLASDDPRLAALRALKPRRESSDEE